MSDIRSYIDDLFRYIESYEKSYSESQTEAFIQTYQGVYAVFQALRQQRDEAVMVDQCFLGKVRQSPLNSSDLRQLTIQVLVSFFESEADIDGQSNQVYSYCRSLRSVRQDVPYFETSLMPLLFREGSLNGNFRLNSFFLAEIARFIQKFGKPLQVALAPEAFAAMPDPLKLLELARRRLELGTDLIGDRSSLEFHLRQVDAFEKLKQRHRLFESYLRDWEYLVTRSYWLTVRNFLARSWVKIKGAFSSWRYFRLVIGQRNPAFLFYGVIIVVMILLAILVPTWWGNYGDGQLEDFKERVESVQSGSK